MIRSLIKLGLFLVAGILIYNFFFGTPDEKQQSKEIFGKVRDLTRDAWGLLRSEKEKFDDGKYDEAVDKLGGIYRDLRSTAEKVQDSGALERLSELEQKRRELEGQLNDDRPQGYDTQEKAHIEREWTDLMRETEDLMRDMESGQ